MLPANYAFTAADAGTHTFGVTLKTAGSQTVTLSDPATATLAATSTPAAVFPANAASFAVAGLGDAVAGTDQSVVVSARDPYGNVANSYRGTVGFGSNDPAATLPSDYPFTAADAGTHSFSVTLKTAGQRSVSVTDRANSALVGSQTAAISSGPAVALAMSTSLTQIFHVLIRHCRAGHNCRAGLQRRPHGARRLRQHGDRLHRHRQADLE